MKDWKPYGYTLTPLPEYIRAELRYFGVKGEFRFFGPLKDGFYRIEVRVA